MTSLFNYLLQSAFCTLLLFAIYWFFLRRETYFLINRFYLLGLGLSSLLIPLLPETWVTAQNSGNLTVLLEPIIVSGNILATNLVPQGGFMVILLYIYIAGVVFFTFRLLFQIVRLLFLAGKSGIRKENGYWFVCIDKNLAPGSFFNLVFIQNKNIHPSRLQTILFHEQIHIRQFHSLDLIILELIMIFQWFNPVIWLIGREIRTVHEYLADEAVLKSGVSKPNYQQMILEESLGLRVNLLANHFNVSLIKSRIVMMTKSKSGLWAKGKVLFALPVVFLMMILFSSNSFSKTEPPQDVPKDKATSRQANEAYKTVEKMPSFPGGDEARVNFMMKNLKYPEEAMKKNITGKVFVNFIVRADGSISSVKVLRGIGGGCDEEAVRVIRLMPKWNPGMDKGKPVDVQFTMPIVFMLDADKSKSGEKASKPDQNK